MRKNSQQFLQCVGLSCISTTPTRSHCQAFAIWDTRHHPEAAGGRERGRLFEPDQDIPMSWNLSQWAYADSNPKPPGPKPAMKNH